MNLLKEIRNSADLQTILLPVESRATITAAGANSGKEAISKQTFELLAPLRARLVCVDLGATFMTGLVGNVSIPSYSDTSCKWKGETAVAENGAGSTSEILLSPKRLTSYIEIGKLFLNQDSINAEKLLMDDIINSITSKLESTIFGKVAGNATMPGGFFVSDPTIKGSASWQNIIDMELSLAAANALNPDCKYISNAAGRGILKSTLKTANTPGYLLEGNTLNNYPLLATNHIASGLQPGFNEEGIIFGYWPDLLIGQWDKDIELTIDKFSAATNGSIRVIVNSYFDVALRRSESFKTGSMKM